MLLYQFYFQFQKYDCNLSLKLNYYLSFIKKAKINKFLLMNSLKFNFNLNLIYNKLHN